MKKIIILIICLAVALPAFAKNENKNKKQKNLPPGLQKKLERTGELPPGWQKKLVKGEVLDTSLYEIGKQHPVKPGDYSLKPRVGTEILRIKDKIIRINNDTRVIQEVFGVKTEL
jgi:hypothetical protein